MFLAHRPDNPGKFSPLITSLIKCLSYGRWILVGLAFIAGWHLLTYFRTMHYGETASSLAFYFVGGGMIFIPSLPLFWGTGDGKPERYALTLMIAAIIAASLWANIEEKLVTNLMPHICEIHPCIQDEDDNFVYTRAAPFDDHEFRYHPENGWHD